MINNNSYYNNINLHNSMPYKAAPLFQKLRTDTMKSNRNQMNENHILDESFPEEKVIINDENSISNSTPTNNSKTNQKKSREFFSINKENLNILGFSIDIDDLLIISIIIFLFLDNKRDYLLLIILCLMLFNISADTFKNMNIIKHLFDPS